MILLETLIVNDNSQLKCPYLIKGYSKLKSACSLYYSSFTSLTFLYEDDSFKGDIIVHASIVAAGKYVLLFVPVRLLGWVTRFPVHQALVLNV